MLLTMYIQELVNVRILKKIHEFERLIHNAMKISFIHNVMKISFFDSYTNNTKLQVTLLTLTKMEHLI